MKTVDINEFKLWLQGTLLEFHNGKGIAVNEKECQEAEDALMSGEEVICRSGCDLIGTKLRYNKNKDVIEEVYAKGIK